MKACINDKYSVKHYLSIFAKVLIERFINFRTVECFSITVLKHWGVERKPNNIERNNKKREKRVDIIVILAVEREKRVDKGNCHTSRCHTSRCQNQQTTKRNIC